MNALIAKTADAFTRAMLAGDARAVAAMLTVDGSELPLHHPAPEMSRLGTDAAEGVPS